MAARPQTCSEAYILYAKMKEQNIEWLYDVKEFAKNKIKYYEI